MEIESLVRGIWRLRVSKAERRVLGGGGGVLVKLKTVAEIRRSSDGDTFIVESVYLVLNSLLDWKPVEKLKHRLTIISPLASNPTKNLVQDKHSLL